MTATRGSPSIGPSGTWSWLSTSALPRMKYAAGGVALSVETGAGVGPAGALGATGSGSAVAVCAGAAGSAAAVVVAAGRDAAGCGSGGRAPTCTGAGAAGIGVTATSTSAVRGSVRSTGSRFNAEAINCLSFSSFGWRRP